MRHRERRCASEELCRYLRDTRRGSKARARIRHGFNNPLYPARHPRTHAERLQIISHADTAAEVYSIHNFKKRTVGGRAVESRCAWCERGDKSCRAIQE